MAKKRPQGFSDEVKEIIWGRARGCCERCGLGFVWGDGRYEFHHRQPRGMGGSTALHVNLASNGLLLCHACHGWVEANRDIGRECGWLVPRNGVLLPAEVSVFYPGLGRFLLDDGGGKREVV